MVILAVASRGAVALKVELRVLPLISTSPGLYSIILYISREHELTLYMPIYISVSIIFVLLLSLPCRVFVEAFPFNLGIFYLFYSTMQIFQFIILMVYSFEADTNLFS